VWFDVVIIIKETSPTPSPIFILDRNPIHTFSSRNTKAHTGQAQCALKHNTDTVVSRITYRGGHFRMRMRRIPI
jgi:hypothetical protein